MKTKFNAFYAGIHGTYWMYFGVIASFSSIFLLDKGYRNTEIGMILMFGGILSVIIQPLLADVADRSKRISVFALMKIGAGILIFNAIFLSILPDRSFLLAAFYVLSYGIGLTLQPFCNSISAKLETIGIQVNFGICRAFGSLCYAVLLMFLGSLTDIYGVISISIAGILVMILYIIVVTLMEKSSRSFREEQGKHADVRIEQNVDELPSTTSNELNEEKQINLFNFAKRHKAFFIMNIGVACVFFGDAVVNGYMAQIAAGVGGTSEDVGRIFAVLAIMEIPPMVLFARLNKRFKCSSMLKLSAIGFVIWLAGFAVSTSVSMLFAIQLFQPIAFALFLPSMIRFISDNMDRGEEVKGHMLFTSTTTVAWIFASFTGGIILDYATPRILSIVATVITAIGAVVILLLISKVEENKSIHQDNKVL